MELTKSNALDPQEWNQELIKFETNHFLQSWQWGQFKGRFGWEPFYFIWRDSDEQIKALALILKRTIASGFSVLYCPHGPILDWSDNQVSSKIIADLSRLAYSEKAIFIKIDPHLSIEKVASIETNSAHEGTRLKEQLADLGWRFSPEQIQFKNTMVLNLDLSEEELLKQMKQKTRYNIRLASRREVHIRKGGVEDLDLLYRIYGETSIRDGFAIREPTYYQDAWGMFMNANMAQPFIAEVEGDPVAGIIVFRFGDVATYMYGMSRAVHREKMPNYLLQWKAIKWAKSVGCRTYDFWGAPDEVNEGDPLWGVYRFKAGFGAQLLRMVGAWDFPNRPILYWLYSILLPRILGLMRIRGRAQTRSSLD
jgi:lipid II:glycine glycyltransferase (peptidoglycan interpeptide bridge formation enzyme)